MVCRNTLISLRKTAICALYMFDLGYMAESLSNCIPVLRALVVFAKRLSPGLTLLFTNGQRFELIVFQRPGYTFGSFYMFLDLPTTPALLSQLAGLKSAPMPDCNKQTEGFINTYDWDVCLRSMFEMHA